MTKQKLDIIFISLLLLLLAVIRPILFDLTLSNTLYGFIPPILMALSWLLFPTKFILNFIVSFFSFFIVIDMRPWFIQFTSHYITASMALIFSLSLTLLLKHQTKEDPLDGTFLRFFQKKFPQLNLFLLFIIDTLVSGSILSLMFIVSIQKITFFHLIAAFFNSGYYSGTAVYFYLYLPENKKIRE